MVMVTMITVSGTQSNIPLSRVLTPCPLSRRRASLSSGIRGTKEAFTDERRGEGMR